jgi:hypothetical protein
VTIADYAREKGWERYNVVDDEGNSVPVGREVVRVIAELAHASILTLRGGVRVQVQKVIKG